jgi:hypothetical protein
MLEAMPTEFQERCETIEECYEFTLSYAAQGHASDEGSAPGRQLREHLTKAVEAMRGLESSCTAAIVSEQLAPAERYLAFFAVLARDAADAVAAIELVLAQRAISSQLIDNLNASIHLRALLTDLFLVAEILEAQQAGAAQQTAAS